MRQQRRWYSPPATPILERVDAVRRGASRSLSLRTVGPNRSPSLFLSSLLLASPSHPYLPIPSPSSLSPPDARDARLSLFLAYTFSPALTFSHSHICLSRTIAGCFSVVSRSRRAPHSLSMRSTPTSLPRRRDRRANIPLAHNPSTKRAICNN